MPTHPDILFAYLFAYIGPETILPLASVLGAIGGVLMMFWNKIRSGMTWCAQRVRPKDEQTVP